MTACRRSPPKNSGGVMILSVMTRMAVLGSCLLIMLTAQPVVQGFSPIPTTATRTSSSSSSMLWIDQLRGGSSTLEEEDLEIESSDEEEEEEEEEVVDTKLTQSTQSAIAKTRAKAREAATKATKDTIKASLSTTTKAKSKKATASSTSSMLQRLFSIPYIVKASLNPFTLLQMTKGYWKSLFNIHYLKNESGDDSSGGLRNALERKAKQGGPARKGKRKFKPGQAKTLSDLPQLNT